MTFRILSLDGGGIRGAFTASFLAQIESRIDGTIGDYFDLVAGTSTGGLIAIAVAAGIPANSVVKLYETHGPEIFRPQKNYRARTRAQRLLISPALRILRPAARKLLGVRVDDLLQTKYRAEALKAALVEVFADSKVETLRKCRVVIPSVDATAGRIVVFKTPHLPNLTRDRHESLVDVLLATTAAPTYFPHAANSSSGAFLDGGLWANNPSLVAYTEAMKIKMACTRDVDPQFTPNEVQIFSIGTGEPRYSLKPPGNQAGLGWWGPKVFDVMSMSQSQGVDCHLRYLLGNRYRRINFDVPDSSWTLDAIEHLGALVHTGRQTAHDHLAGLIQDFFSEGRPDYAPFEENGERTGKIAVASAC